VWVDVNTHTHANWVFTEPGVYLLRLLVTADLVDGSSVSDTQLIRLAVGTATDPADAFAAAWTGADGTAVGSPSTTDSAVAAPGESTDPLVPILIAVIAVVAVALVVGFTVTIVRGNRAKRRILDARIRARGDGA
jgi:surface-anchored protein